MQALADLLKLESEAGRGSVLPSEIQALPLDAVAWSLSAALRRLVRATVCIIRSRNERVPARTRFLLGLNHLNYSLTR